MNIQDRLNSYNNLKAAYITLQKQGKIPQQQLKRIYNELAEQYNSILNDLRNKIASDLSSDPINMNTLANMSITQEENNGPLRDFVSKKVQNNEKKQEE